MLQQNRTPDMETVYNEHFSDVYNYVFYKLLNRENTEDIVSQVFEKVLRKLYTFDPDKASVRTWIFRIADNTLIDYYRRRKPTVSLDGEIAMFEGLSVHFDEQYNQIIEPERKAVFAALKQLPERERMFIYYRYYQNISNREIARQMNMNENTVSAIMARARQKLRSILADA